MKKIIVASNNKGKISEIKALLSNYHYDVISMKEAGIDIDIEENGSTFYENAYIKASTIYKRFDGKCSVLADDSGLCVDALNGEPGIMSARFAGEHGNSEKNNEKLLELLKGVPERQRTAKFVCAIVFIAEGSRILKVKGEIEGLITEEARGKGGFGYDPLFYIPEYKKTFAELGSSIKNSISHRARALKELESSIKKF